MTQPKGHFDRDQRRKNLTTANDRAVSAVGTPERLGELRLGWTSPPDELLHDGLALGVGQTTDLTIYKH